MKMYRLYRDWLDLHDENEVPVKLSYYRCIVRGFHLGFKPPNTDACCKCDRFKVMKQQAKSKEEAARVQDVWDKHMELTNKGLATMACLEKDNNPEVRCICLGLQQTQPVPRLSTSVAYYKRKLWLYNLCIHDLKKNESKFYLWDEMNGGRGSAEIVSCMSKWIDEELKKGSFTTLKVVSDGGQNKNINMILFYLREIHSKRLQFITHTYLMAGHSYMACDRAFGNTEKQILRTGDIYDFQGYARAIKLTVVKKYPVIPITHNDFLNIDVLQKQVTTRKPQAPHNFQDARTTNVTCRYGERGRERDP